MARNTAMTRDTTATVMVDGKQNGQGLRQGGFDPFADLLAAQGSRPTCLRPVNLRTLTPFQRALLRDLACEPAGIGRVLLHSQIENRREILWYGRERIANLPEEIERCTGHEFISRTYRIIAEGQLVMWINKKFPVEKGHVIRDHA